MQGQEILKQVQNDRAGIRIGIPRTLNMYSVAPFFIAYFEKAGVPYKNIILSDYTDEKMYKEGSRRGAIDACFPSKVALSHMHNLIYNKKVRPDAIFFPMLLDLPSEIKEAIAKSLGNTKSKKAIPVLLPLLNDKNLNIRHSASDALIKLGWTPTEINQTQ